MVGKLHVGSFFSPPLSALTCSPAGQHILSTSVGLAGQAEPCLLSPPQLPTSKPPHPQLSLYPSLPPAQQADPIRWSGMPQMWLLVGRRSDIFT